MSKAISYENITANTLLNFYRSDALCLEGLALSSLKDYADWIDANGGLKENSKFSIVSGELVNEVFGLEDADAYPEDLNIVLLPLSSIESIGKMAISRFSVGARWFKDVIDNSHPTQNADCYWDDEDTEYDA